jgi:hypothetical protein
MNWSRVLLAVGMSVALAACASNRASKPVPAPPGATAGAVAPTPTVTPRAYGELQFGMTPAEGSKLLMRPLKPLNAAEEQEPCHYVFPDGDTNATFAFMVSEGRIVRIDVSSPVVPTAEGARVGDSEAEVLQTYGGKAEVTPHKYRGPNDHYLTVYDADSTHALVFETQDGTVTGYHAGKLPEAQYIEGCS